MTELEPGAAYIATLRGGPVLSRVRECESPDGQPLEVIEVPVEDKFASATYKWDGQPGSVGSLGRLIFVYDHVGGRSDATP